MSDRTPNQRQSRSEATQDALIHAAIALIAENGLENISIRSIIEASGQKNESALQYHFKNRDGLIKA
ncbi:MAG: TetR family transcriptional regulator, partial [Pseudomonadales bacterium]